MQKLCTISLSGMSICFPCLYRSVHTQLVPQCAHKVCTAVCSQSLCRSVHTKLCTAVCTPKFVPQCAHKVCTALCTYSLYRSVHTKFVPHCAHTVCTALCTYSLYRSVHTKSLKFNERIRRIIFPVCLIEHIAMQAGEGVEVQLYAFLL